MGAIEKVIIYSDGSADNRVADHGSAATIIIYKGKVIDKFVSGSWSSTTNNRMELLAAIQGFERVKDSRFAIKLITDSQYVITSIKNVKSYTDISYLRELLNGDLMVRLWKTLKFHKRDGIEVEWTKGHAGDKYNELCDQLAGEAALRPNPTRDVGSKIGPCPIMAWMYHSDHKLFFLELKNNVEKIVSGNPITLVGPARKMSKKELLQLLKKNQSTIKSLKGYEVDISAYVKPR